MEAGAWGARPRDCNSDSPVCASSSSPKRTSRRSHFTATMREKAAEGHHGGCRGARHRASKMAYRGERRRQAVRRGVDEPVTLKVARPRHGGQPQLRRCRLQSATNGTRCPRGWRMAATRISTTAVVFGPSTAAAVTHASATTVAAGRRTGSQRATLFFAARFADGSPPHKLRMCGSHSPVRRRAVDSKRCPMTPRCVLCDGWAPTLAHIALQPLIGLAGAIQRDGSNQEARRWLSASRGNQTVDVKRIHSLSTCSSEALEPITRSWRVGMMAAF